MGLAKYIAMNLRNLPRILPNKEVAHHTVAETLNESLLGFPQVGAT